MNSAFAIMALTHERDTMKTLTKENAREGMTIRKALDISMARELKWCEELSAWVYCHRGQWCHLREETMHEWKIVEDAPEPPIVSTDQNYPPELPIGHVDAPGSVLKALGERIDDNITRIEAFVDQSDGAEIPEFKRFIEAMHVEFDNMQRIIGDKANSRTVGTDSVLEGFRPLVDEAMDAMDAMSATVSLSKENGVLFDSVTGCLLMMENILGKASTPQVEPEPDGHWKCLKCGRLNAPSRSKCRYPECEAPRGSRGITEPEPAPDKLTGTDDPERSIWQIGDEICNRVRELQEKWRKINE